MAWFSILLTVVASMFTISAVIEFWLCLYDKRTGTRTILPRRYYRILERSIVASPVLTVMLLSCSGLFYRHEFSNPTPLQPLINANAEPGLALNADVTGDGMSPMIYVDSSNRLE